VLHNDLLTKGVELLLMPTGAAWSLARTVALQPFEEFGQRDFGRPGFDAASGMLPPKVALMMLNLSGIPREGAMLDPFCGSGTILMEAFVQGYANITGSDISAAAAESTKKNI